MCCRYGYETGTKIDIRELADYVSSEAEHFRACDVHPSEPGVVLRTGAGHSEIRADVMLWGLSAFNKKLLINARAETALEKKSFSDSVLRRRCIIPAACFYEWDRDKVKNTFRSRGDSSLYMAGFYNIFDNENRFIILTTAANESMNPVHDRMPLILPRSQAIDWIRNDAMVREYLSSRPSELDRSAEYEQLSLQHFWKND